MEKYEIIADELDGIEISNQNEIIPEYIEQKASEMGVVIVYGEYEDVVLFRGSITDAVEQNATKFKSTDKNGRRGYQIHISKNGEILENTNECIQDDCPYHKKFIQENTHNTVVAAYGRTGVWSFYLKRKIPFEDFELYDSGNLRCIGICFSMEDFKNV